MATIWKHYTLERLKGKFGGRVETLHGLRCSECLEDFHLDYTPAFCPSCGEEFLGEAPFGTRLFADALNSVGTTADAEWIDEALAESTERIAESRPSAEEVEPPDSIPTVISAEAWESAMTIMQEVEKLHLEAGFVRREGYSKSTKIAAQMVQLSINKFLHRMQERITRNSP